MARKVTSKRLKSAAGDCSYSGMIFRSHLEAKWALIFDILGWDTDYEPGTYRITPTMAYVPDFYVHPLRMWAEVKGPPFLSRESIAKICASVAGNNRLPIRSEPFTKSERILVLGDITPVSPGELPVVSLIRDLGAKRLESWMLLLTYLAASSLTGKFGIPSMGLAGLPLAGRQEVLLIEFVILQNGAEIVTGP